jgi:hypothetical protein
MKGMTFSKEPVVWLGLQERNCVMQSLKLEIVDTGLFLITILEIFLLTIENNINHILKFYLTV